MDMEYCNTTSTCQRLLFCQRWYQVNPTLIKKLDLTKKKILNDDTSSKINSILRKVVISGTASLSDVDGYEVGGKTVQLSC